MSQIYSNFEFVFKYTLRFILITPRPVFFFRYAGVNSEQIVQAQFGTQSVF